MFLLKLNFTKKHTDEPKRSFRSLTKVWSSKESLSVGLLLLMPFFVFPSFLNDDLARLVGSSITYITAAPTPTASIQLGQQIFIYPPITYQ